MKYQAIKGNRIKYGFIGIITYQEDWWFHKSVGFWLNHDDSDYKWDGKAYRSHQRCNSVRAFHRKLKKCPKGVEFILVSRWKGYDVTGYNTKKL